MNNVIQLTIFLAVGVKTLQKAEVQDITIDGLGNAEGTVCAGHTYCTCMCVQRSRGFLRIDLYIHVHALGDFHF